LGLVLRILQTIILAVGRRSTSRRRKWLEVDRSDIYGDLYRVRVNFAILLHFIHIHTFYSEITAILYYTGP